MNNFYRVMEILEVPDFAWSEMLYEVARTNPKAVVDAVTRLQRKKTVKDLNPSDPNKWKEKCRDLMRSGRKIEAIKTCREATGLGLKEAKELVEGIHV